MRHAARLTRVLAVAIAWCSSPGAGAGAEGGDRPAYITPPPAVLEAVLAAREDPFEKILPSPIGTRYLAFREAGLPPLALLDRPVATWGGLKVDVKARRSVWAPLAAVESPEVRDFEGRRVSIKVPAGVRIGQVQWSPDGRRVSFVAHSDDGSRLFVADPATGDARPASASPLLLVRHPKYHWTADGRNLVALLASADGTNPPPAPRAPVVLRFIPGGPDRRPAGTSPPPLDDELYRRAHTGQLALIDVEDGTERKVGQPAMILSVRPSPDASYFRVAVQAENTEGGLRLEEAIWDREGRVVSRLRAMESGPDGRPVGGPEPWNPLLLAEWTPGGGGMHYASPWGVTHWSPARGRAEAAWRTSREVREICYSGDGRVLFARLGDGEGEAVVAVRLESPGEVRTLARWGPGQPGAEPARVLTRNPTGDLDEAVLSADRGRAYLVAPRGSSRAFLDRVEIATGERTRIWQGAADTLDELVAVLDDDADRLLIRSQSPTDPPDYFLRHRSGATTRLTHAVDPSPAMTRCPREDLTVRRADGFRFRVRVTLPRPRTDGPAPPALFWFYPAPYVDQAAYDAAIARALAGPRLAFPAYTATSPRIITQAGYAAVELDCPIVGPPGKAYDGYARDLSQNLAATVDELARRGLVDRARLAIGGHSGGATAAACALAYTDHFRAGIAQSGSYDMLLSPTGTGSGHERRPLWEARENYLAMSALLHVDRIRGALLITHGAADTNPLTRPVNAEALYQGLEALGRTTMLCLYPLEDHDLAARETILDQWARQVLWLDEHVKGPPR